MLINVPGFKKQAKLDAFERIVTAERLRSLYLKPLKGKLDKKHLCDIHKFIFEDVYPFAGKMRDEDISKGNFRFATARFLHEQTEELLSKLTYYLVELNVLHPFRECFPELHTSEQLSQGGNAMTIFLSI